MVFRARGLSVIGYANGFTLWHYATQDDRAEIMRAGYFDPAANLLRTGDFVFVNYAMGDRPSHCILVVTERQDERTTVAALAAMSESIGAKLDGNRNSTRATLPPKKG